MTPSGARLIVTSVAACCAFIVLTLPRATAPRPPLLLPTDAERELPDTLATEEVDAVFDPGFNDLAYVPPCP